MIKEWILLLLMFLICNKFYNRPELLFLSYTGFILAVILYTKAVANFIKEGIENGHNREGLL